MPNNCQNILSVAGPEKDLEEFTAKHEDGKFSLAAHFPYGTEDGEWDYNWCVKNWGTKWDVYESGNFLSSDGTTPAIDRELHTQRTQIGIDYGMLGEYADNEYAPTMKEVSCSFLTAWAPPEAGITTISGKYPNLLFTIIYCEAGNDFAGTSKMQAGMLISEEGGDIEEYIEKYDFSNAF